MTAPVGKAVWMPILHAMIAGAFGASIGALNGGDWHIAALLFAFGAWVVSTVLWLNILASAYMPTPIIKQGETPLPVPEPEPDDYLIVCTTDASTRHRIDPDCPVSWDWFTHFAIEVGQGRGVSYRDWVGYEDGFSTNPEYKVFVDWLQERGYASGGMGQPTRLTDLGKCLLRDIVTGSFRRYFPSGDEIIP